MLRSPRRWFYQIVIGALAAMDHNDADFGAFNLGNSPTVTLSDQTMTAEQALGKQPKSGRLLWHPCGMRRIWSGMSKARSLLEFETKADVADKSRYFVSSLHDKVQHGADQT